MKSLILLLTVAVSLALIDGLPARNREGGANRCKYRKGQWGECNASTLKRTRIDTLTADSPSTCNATKTTEKACRRKTCEYGEWTEYGACENNKQTKTRPIVTGTQEECGKKAKKTKTCRSNSGARAQNAGGQRRGGGGTRRGGNPDTSA